jgi:hypothetical protein
MIKVDGNKSLDTDHTQEYEKVKGLNGLPIVPLVI